jgi:hypothetical protein
MLGDGTICGEEPLRVPRGFEPLQAPLPLACQLVGSLRTVVQILVLPRFYTGQHLPLGRAIAFEFVRDEYPWHVGQALEQLPEELFGRALVPPPLHQNIEDIPVLIHPSSLIVAFAANGEKDLVQMPRVTRLRVPATELIGIRLAELPAPLPDGFIGHNDSPGEQQLFDIAIAEGEAAV